MRPVIIYTMPRTRGTAILMSCLHPERYNEPLMPHNLITDYHAITRKNNTAAHLSSFISDEQWTHKFELLNRPESACKIFGTDLDFSKKTESWFLNAQKHNTHDIFVVNRDIIELGLSLFIANMFGWCKSEEKTPTDFKIDYYSYTELELIIKNHIRYYPTVGQPITIDTMPRTHFNIDRNENIINQESEKKYALIKNLDQIKVNLKQIADFYQPELEEKKAALIHQQLI